MPKEHKKRGRREEKKRKRENEDGEEDIPSKRRRSQEAEGAVDLTVKGDDFGHELGYIPIAVQDGTEIGEEHMSHTGLGDLPFYGLLDEDEQEYFKRADSMLEFNQFADVEERNLFLASVYREANGKELKIANSQSCSRLMERLIILSTPDQLKALFQKFSGHFLHLVQHRFASHCCEALFLKAAPIVTTELMAPPEEAPNSSSGDVYVSMENLFIYTVDELQGNLGYLMTDQFASHPLRNLLVILSGMPLAALETASLMQSKKKEHVSVTGGATKSAEEKPYPRTMPEAFQAVVDKMIIGTVAGLDTTNLRTLAMHPITNPVLQLLLQLELTRSGKQSAKDTKSLFRKLLPDDPPEEGTDSAGFINSLTYDTVGSRLLEVIVTQAPGKTFKALYKSSFDRKLGTLAKNEVAAFVVIKIIERLNKEDLQNAVDQLCPQIDTLIKRSRTAVIKTLIERCRVRQLDTQPISLAIQKVYGEQSADMLTTMLKVNTTPTDGLAEDRRMQLEAKDSAKVHGSLLVQCMLEALGPLRELITDGLLAMEAPALIAVAKDRTASRVLQSALTCSEQSPKFRRMLIPRLYDYVEDLATDTVASHVIDSLWQASEGLAFIREKIANELARHETILRASVSGRAVWRNWKMDVYRTRKHEWLNDAKGQGTKPKSGLELARERAVLKKKTPNHQQKGSKLKAQVPTSANRIQTAAS